MLVWIVRLLFYASACGAAVGMWMRTQDLPSEALLLPDKAWHVVVYAILTVLARLGHPRTALWWIAPGVFVFSIALEVGQGLGGAGRMVEPGDVAANLAGVLAGALAGSAALRAWRRLRRRYPPGLQSG